MPELIDKDRLRYIESDKDAYTEDWNADYERGFCDAINKALKLPTIEPEVRHGRWIFVGEETMHDGWTYRKHKCSECDFVTVEAKNFCQNCGSKMYGGADNA